MQSEMIWHRGRKAVFVIGASSRGSEEPEPPVSCFGRLHVCTCVHTPPENSDECTPKGRERREWKVALTPMTFFCQDHSSDPPLVHAHSDLCLSLSQVVVVVSSSTAASPALGELESIPAVFKRRWGKTLDLWPVYLRAT